jgi:predicted metal-dependent phosphoesterase TrpH
MEKWADLHIHTYFSDGTSSPQEVLQQASSCGLSAIAITDHDTIEGILPTQHIADTYNIEVISGIEFSTEINGRDVHLLGYLFDPEHPYLTEKLVAIQNMRIQRMKEMIVKLKNLGVADIDFEEVAALTKSAVGRPHLAAVLMKKGKVSSIREAFDKYLHEGGLAYVDKFRQTPFEAIELMKQVGGVSVLAHPMVTLIDELIPQLAQAGLTGIEAHYPNSSKDVVEFYNRLAEKNNLLVTGGSDAHGEAKRNTYIGRLKIPYELVEKLKAAK